jgi:catechol 2,3-dioxygenase-like lactoylglutathione lyase family enzyme
MTIRAIAPQLRTTDMKSSIEFYTEKLAFEVAFNFEDFYTGIRAGGQMFHLKLVDEKDPSITFVHEGGHLHLYFETDDVTAVAERLKENGVALVKDVHNTDWQTREIVLRDDQGHTLYFGQRLSTVA